MAVHHMEPLALWGKNAHTTSSSEIFQGDIHDYVVFHIPRNMFRQAASTFSDVRHAESSARFDEIALQLFLQMTFETANMEEDKLPPDIVFPYVKVWLEWVPSRNLKDNAVCYRLHAVSLHEKIKFGTALSSLLYEASRTHKDSMNRKMNSRKQDPLSGLHPYQKWMRVSGLEMYVRTICDRYAGSQQFTANMDMLLNPKLPISEFANLANPRNVFSIQRMLDKTPDSADEAFGHLAGYTNCDADNVALLRFPSAEHVMLLTPSQLHPKVFCSKYLPDHQRWMEVQRAIPTKQLEDDYDPNCETEYDIRTSADIEKDRLEGLTDRSAFASLAIQSKAKYRQDVLDKEGTLEFDEAYRTFQDWAIHAMKTQCLDPDACISDVVSKMITWRENHPEAAVIKHRITDETLSVFANRVIALMEGYEQYFLISTAHRMMFLINHARYDSFRRDFGLHFNCFQAGDGATSKSFLFLMMEKLSIPGTIEVLTYQTGKADAVDGNRNDITTVCHEAPPGMFRTGKNPNADSSQEAMFKEKLTSQRVTAKVWCQEESTGRRSARLTKSECIGVWMGATNDPPSEVEDALKTRFFWGNFEQQQRKGRDIDDCMNGERMMSSADKAIRKKLFLEGQEEQYRVMLVEKAIWCKVIKDVNMEASNIIVPRLKQKMTKDSIICPGPRDWERVKILSRCMAIVTAIERVCNLPGGKHYDKPFDESMIPDLEPYLRVTEEMVIFVLSLLSDQFRSPVEHKILNTIYNMEKRSPKFQDPNSDEACYDYIKLPKLRQLSKKINSRIPLDKGRTSAHNIENFILNMAKHSIRARKYEPVPVTQGTSTPEDNFPIVKKSNKSIKQSCVVTNEGVFIHVAHVLAHKEDSSDNVFQILASESHKHSDRKRMITACPLDSSWFHVFRVIDRTPRGKGLHYKNVLANTRTSRWITGTGSSSSQTRTMDGYSINEDIDTHVAKKWARIIGKQTQTPEQMVETVIDEEDYDRPMISYPTQFVEDRKQLNKRKRSQEEVSDDEDAMFDNEDDLHNHSKRIRNE